MFLGQARGRVGSVVFSRRMGKQITRTYNAEPANPKTRAQALQRAQFSTVIAASVGLKEVINNSFDGVNNGQESVNKFVSLNLSDLRARALDGDSAALEWLVPKGQSFVQPQSWIISKGQLGQILPNIANIFGDSTTVETATGGSYSVFTVADLKQRFYYEPGCQLTFVTVELTEDVDGNSVYVPKYDRIVFNNLAPSAGSDPVIIFSYGQEEHFAIKAEYVDLTKTTLHVNDEYSYADGTIKAVELPDYFAVESLGGKTNSHLAEGYICLGVITTVLRDGNYVHSTSYIRPNFDGYDYTEDAVSTYLAQSSNARKVISSDYYTEQPTTDYNDWEVPTLEQVVSAQIQALGMQAKGVYIGQSNSYGPVAEGVPMTLSVDLPARFQIRANSVKAYNGETPLGNDWYITRSGTRGVIITGPMPTTTSFPFNVSFEVDDSFSGSHVGRAALRINVSKANS